MNGDRLRLQVCGENASTLWIADTNYQHDGALPFIDSASRTTTLTRWSSTEVSGAPAYQQLHVNYLDVDTAGVVSDRQLVRLIPGS